MTRLRLYLTPLFCLVLPSMLGLTTSSVAQTQKVTDEAALATHSEGVEAPSDTIHRVHQSEIALFDQIEKWQSAIGVSACNFHDQAQV